MYIYVYVYIYIYKYIYIYIYVYIYHKSYKKSDDFLQIYNYRNTKIKNKVMYFSD